MPFPSFNWTHEVTRTLFFLLSPYSTRRVSFMFACWAEGGRENKRNWVVRLSFCFLSLPDPIETFSFRPPWFLCSISPWTDEAMMQSLIQISLSENLFSFLVHSAQFDYMKRRREGRKGSSASLLAEETILFEILLQRLFFDFPPPRERPAWDTKESKTKRYGSTSTTFTYLCLSGLWFGPYEATTTR